MQKGLYLQSTALWPADACNTGTSFANKARTACKAYSPLDWCKQDQSDPKKCLGQPGTQPWRRHLAKMLMYGHKGYFLPRNQRLKRTIVQNVKLKPNSPETNSTLCPCLLARPTGWHLPACPPKPQGNPGSRSWFYPGQINRSPLHLKLWCAHMLHCSQPSQTHHTYQRYTQLQHKPNLNANTLSFNLPPASFWNGWRDSIKLL